MWRGSSQGSPYIREAFVDFSATEGGSSVSDVKFSGVFDPKTDLEYINLEDHCNWKYLLHLRGVSYSGRLKYLLSCGSVVIIVKNNFEEFYYHKLPGNVLFTANESTPNELLQIVKDLENDEERQQKLAKSVQAFVETFLSQDAIHCYMYKVLKQYGSLMSYDIQLNPLSRKYTAENYMNE